MKAPSASDNPDAPVTTEIPTTMTSVIAMISSRLPVRPAERISGETRYFPTTMMSTTTASDLRKRQNRSTSDFVRRRHDVR